jgi:S1-C subfamily serine protease
MNWLDVFIVIFLLAALVRGTEVGFVRQFFGAAGFFGGLFLGALLEGKLIHLAHSPNSKAMLVLCVVLGCALLLMTLGEYMGLRIKFMLRETRVIEKIDRVLGSALALVTMLAVIWLGASIFRNVPDGAWQRQIRSSRVIATLTSELPSAPDVLTKLGHLIDPNGFPQVFSGLEPNLPSEVAMPDMGELNVAVQKTKPSIVKIEGEGCGGIVEGSGFVAASGTVVTNAHVIAGVIKPFIVDQNGQHRAQVIWFDANLDLAILRASNLKGAPLTLDGQTAEDSTAAAIAGYPGGNGFTAGPAAVIDSFTARGRNIYNQGDTNRSVYSVKADVEQGNSGGPLLDKNGSVIGVVFAKSTKYNDVGYALTADQVIQSLTAAQKSNSTVGTGNCAP